MVCCNHLLQIARIAVLAYAAVADQLAIPNVMQITGVVTALGRAKKSNRDVVSSTRVAHGVEWLAKIAYKMNQKLERFAPSR